MKGEGVLREKAISGLMLTLLFIGMLTLAFNIQPVKAELGRLETVWVSDYLGEVRGVETSDIDMDGITEIIAGITYMIMAEDGFIYLFDGITHVEEWKSSRFNYIHSLAVGDVDSDGDAEIVFGTNGTDKRLYVMDAVTHEIEWISDHLVTPIASLRIDDIDGDGTKEIVAGSFDNGLGNYAYIYVFDGVTHVLEWISHDLHWEIRLDVDDVDADGTKEIVCGTRDGYVHVFDAVSHIEEWRSGDLGGYLRGIDVDDVDADGTKEIVVGVAEGYIYVFDGVTHALEWKSSNAGGRIGWISGLLINDVDLDGTKEIVAGLMTGEPGKLPALGVGYVYVYDVVTHDLEAQSDPVDRWIGWGISINDVDNDGRKEIVTGGNDHLYVFRPPPPSYILTIHSSPTGVTFTVDGVPRTTPWSETYFEGTLVNLVMPATHGVYDWDHWSDTDTNRMRTVIMNTNITLTGVFTPPPVGGKAAPIVIPVNEPELQIPWIWLSTLLLAVVVVTVVYVKKRKRNRETNS